MANYSGSPYYDRYEGDSEHKEAGYTRVLAKPGYVEQASEFNEIQSINMDYLSRLGSSMYREGYIVSGCEINIDGTSVTVSKGRVFLQGLVRDVKETKLTITGVGRERVTAVLETSIVSSAQDASLRDPAQGSENFGGEGADRERQVVTLRVEQDDVASAGTTLYSLDGGAMMNEEGASDDTVLMDVLAERTFDENGSYKVEGLVMRNLPEETEDGQIKIFVSEGKAYILGYAVTKNAMSTIQLEPSKETRSVLSESHYYNTTYPRYELTNGPVADIQNLTCMVSVIGEQHSRGSESGGMDPLLHTPVDRITKVYTEQGGGGTNYVAGRDYKLYADQVDWSLSGSDAQEPTAGGTYYVDYVYNRSMEKGTDYEFKNENGRSYLTIKANKPDENSLMHVSYTYTLARRDLILVDRYGEFKVIQGESDRLKSLFTPYNGSDEFLELGYVDVYPTDVQSGKSLSGIAKVVNYDSIRFTQQYFYTMLRRIDSLEDAVAELDLERDLTGEEDTSSLNGYFSDPFKNLDRSDLTYTGRDETLSKDLKYTACIDTEMEELTTAADIKSAELSLNDTDSYEHAVYGTIISAPYEEELGVQQKYVTGTMLVNPYASYGPLCQVILDPAIDNWVDEDTVEVYNTLYDEVTEYKTEYYSRWIPTSTWRGKLMGTETNKRTIDEGTTTSTSSTSSVATTLYEYMRVKDVKVHGKAFSGGMTDIYCTFNKTPVDLTPEGTTSAGTDKKVAGKTVHTVTANENGSFDAKFQVPAKTPCGSVNVVLTGQDELGESHSGQAVYSATGTLRTTTITNTTTLTQHYTVLTEVTNIYSNDPLAQSFMMSSTLNKSLVKVTVYFATKSTLRPAILQVRNMVNGYPGETVYAEVTINPEDVKLPTSPNVPVPTEIKLNQPVFCKAGTYYCFVILSDSNEYSMFYAEMGKNLLGTSEQLIINPYATGVMFSSSNASTWTAHQGADLKFELYQSRFTGSGEIIFDEASINDVTGMFLDAAYQDDANSGLKWYFKYALPDGSYSQWYPTDSLEFRELKAVTNKIILKAVITTDYSTSPYIDTGRVSLRAFIDQKEAMYFSRHITDSSFDEPYKALKISYEAAMPSGAKHTVYYADQDVASGGKWYEVKAGENVTLTTQPVTEEYTRYTWDIKKLDNDTELQYNSRGAGATFFKLRIDLSTTLAYNRPRIRKLAVIFKYGVPE